MGIKREGSLSLVTYQDLDFQLTEEEEEFIGAYLYEYEIEGQENYYLIDHASYKDLIEDIKTEKEKIPKRLDKKLKELLESNDSITLFISR